MKNKLFAVATIATLCLASCFKLPPADLTPVATLNQDAQKMSDSLEAYVRLWLNGRADANLPERLLPTGYDKSRFKNLKLVRYEQIDPRKQWATRPAHEIDFKKQFGSFPDPHCTYLLLPVLYAPFGSKVVMEGAFPYCRFFNIQTSPAFDTEEYRYDKWAGKGEVSLVDADIEPEAGSSNPFRPNADRLNPNRKYKVEYVMAVGNPSVVDKTHKPPYRGKGNTRYGSAIQYQGPLGKTTQNGGHNRGVWDFGDIWVRYYGIDRNKMPMAGVDLPKVYYELKTGERFFIEFNMDGFLTASEGNAPNRNIGGSNPPPAYMSPHIGWDKQFGIYLTISKGLSQALYLNSPDHKQYLRDLDKQVTGRGESAKAPASYEAHATACNHINYLTTGTTIEKGKVFVFTGKMPTFPDTRNSAPKMTTAQCRYWSITSYDVDFPFADIKGMENTSVMDDEIVMNSNREYIIVYSRPEDRPKNATAANGVTWVNWGQTATQSFTLRWLSVAPEWAFEKTPDEINLPWRSSTWTGTQFNPDLIYKNNHNGFMGMYLPKSHYFTKSAFENLGNSLNPKTIPSTHGG